MTPCLTENVFNTIIIEKVQSVPQQIFVPPCAGTINLTYVRIIRRQASVDSETVVNSCTTGVTTSMAGS